jgi:hypothetical protein
MITTRPLLLRKSIPSDALPLRIEQDMQNRIRRSELNSMISIIEVMNTNIRKVMKMKIRRERTGDEPANYKNN